MKKLISVFLLVLVGITFMALFSSCLVFRKSEKHKTEVVQSEKTEIVKNTTENKNEKETTDRQKVSTTDSKSNTTTNVEADEININADGSINAKGNVKASQERKDSNSGSSEERELVSKETSTDTNTNEKVNSSWDLGIKQYDKTPEKPANPIYNWIGGAFFLLIIALGLWAWCKFKPF